MSAVVCIRCGVGSVKNLDSALGKVNIAAKGFRQDIRYAHRNIGVCNAVGKMRAQFQQEQELAQKRYRSLRQRVRRAWLRVRAVAA